MTKDLGNDKVEEEKLETTPRAKNPFSKSQKPHFRVECHEDFRDLETLRGDPKGLNEVLLKYRNRLRKIIALRMNQKLQGRVDASDIIQDAYIEAARTVDKYLADPKLPVFLWLRHLVGEKLIQAHRFHLGAQKRNAERDVSINARMPHANSHSIAFQLIGDGTTPSGAAIKNENRKRLMKALDRMDDLDREVLVLRHFEHMTGRETAVLLDMHYETIKKRYLRGLEKLERIMATAVAGSSSGQTLP